MRRRDCGDDPPRTSASEQRRSSWSVRALPGRPAPVVVAVPCTAAADEGRWWWRPNAAGEAAQAAAKGRAASGGCPQ